MYDEDIDLRAEMAEHLIPILEDPENDGNLGFFLMNQLFIFPSSARKV